MSNVAYLEGGLAYLRWQRDKPPCPYPRSTDKARDWFEGWEAQDRYAACRLEAPIDRVEITKDKPIDPVDIPTPTEEV